MTKEKLQLAVPVVFTIGPDYDERGGAVKDDHVAALKDNGDALMKYAMLLAESGGKSAKGEHISNIIKGIIEGETRVVVSSLCKFERPRFPELISY
jgi:flotillin